MGKSSMKKKKSDHINALRKKYDDFLEEDKKRKERNEYILGRLDKMRAASMALRVPYGIPRTRSVMTTQMIPYPQPRDEPFVQTLPFENQYPIVRDIPTKLTDNTSESRIINEISKRFILIPKLTTLQIEKSLTQTPQKDDQDWTSKYEILDQLKKCEKENIEFSYEEKKPKCKKISFEENSSDEVIIQPKVTEDFAYDKKDPTKIVYKIREDAINKEYDIDTFRDNLEDKNKAQYEYTDSYNNDNTNTDTCVPNVENNIVPAQIYDSKQTTEQENAAHFNLESNNKKHGIDISKSESQSYVEKDVEDNVPKKNTSEQNIKQSEEEYPTNDYTNVNTSEPTGKQEKAHRTEIEGMVEIKDHNTNPEIISEQYDDGQNIQMPIHSEETGIEYYPEQNSKIHEANYIQGAENYQQNNAIDRTELQNYYDETNQNENNVEYTNYPPEQVVENYEQYNQNVPAEYYDNSQGLINQGQEQFEQEQPQQFQYQNQQYEQNQSQPHQYEEMHEQENQLQYDSSQVQEGQYDQLQQPQEYEQENQLQYDSSQVQEGQFDQLQQPQEYEQENQLQYDSSQVQEGQFDQLQQPQEYDQENQLQYDSSQVQPQYEEGLFDQVQEYHSQYDPNQTDNVQYECGQQDPQYSQQMLEQQNDQTQGQYDPAQYDNQYPEQNQHNIVQEAYDPNYTGQTEDENISSEVVPPVE